MATTTAKLFKMASEMNDQQSYTSKAESLASIKMPESFTRPTDLSDLHKAYGQMKQSNYSHEQKEKFKEVCKAKGFQPGNKFDKLLEDPEPSFNRLVRGLENFEKPTRKDWIKDAHEPSFPRYKRHGNVEVGTPQNDKLRTFYLFEKNQITNEELKQRLGEEDFKRIAPMMKNIKDGNYTQAIHELMIDQGRAETVNTNPVKNSREIFSRKYPPSYCKFK
jgi:hypothetical protein